MLLLALWLNRSAVAVAVAIAVAVVGAVVVLRVIAANWFEPVSLTVPDLYHLSPTHPFVEKLRPIVDKNDSS